MKPKGTYVVVGGTTGRFIEAGKIAPVIDRRYPFAEIPAAVSFQESGLVAGKVVVTV